MPIPIIAAAAAAVAAAVEVAASVYAAWLAADVIATYKRQILEAAESALTLQMGPLATGFANDRLSAAGINLQFSDVTDLEAVKIEVDGFAADVINEKVGTNFDSIKEITKDEALSELGRVLSERISSELGVEIVVWPVQALRDSVKAAVIEQVQSNIGGLLPDGAVEAVDLAVLVRLGLNKAADGLFMTPERRRKLAQGAERQRRYRLNNKMHCRC